MAEDPALQRYRRFLVILLLVGSLIAITVGAMFVRRGYPFYALLAVLVLGFLVLLTHGYRQDAEEQAERYAEAQRSDRESEDDARPS